jgi:hypothetical protein
MGTALLAALLLSTFLLAAPPHPALAADHVVGDSVWCIPPSADLYSAWAANRTFVVGDNLGEPLPDLLVPRNNGIIILSLFFCSCVDNTVFRFENGFYDVVQVSRAEHDECTASDPYRTFSDSSPVVVPLDFSGVRYYVCSVGNYCSLGVKFYVAVHQNYQ